MSLIDFNNVSFEYECGKQILDNITFSAKAGESVGLVGSNGVGKSTLLKLIVGLNMSFEGDISVDGLKVEKKNFADIRKRIGYVFQDSDSQLFMSTAIEDVAFGPKNYGLSADKAIKKAEEALERIGILNLRDKQIYKMSGGEKKMVSIATILSMSPDVILMDEPSVALDPKNRRRLINILNDLPCLKLIASHDLDLIWDTCDRTILLSEGRIIADGPTEEILSDEELLEANGLELPLSLYGK